MHMYIYAFIYVYILDNSPCLYMSKCSMYANIYLQHEKSDRKADKETDGS